MMKKKEIYTYQAPWKVYGLGWSERKADDCKFRFACGSFREEYNNKVDIVQYSAEKDDFVRKGGFEHPYPTTKIQWIPDPESRHNDLLATAGDFLRIWRVEDDPEGGDGCSVNRVCQLNSSKNSEYCAPLTSMDWNQVCFSLVDIMVGVFLLSLSNSNCG